MSAPLDLVDSSAGEDTVYAAANGIHVSCPSDARATERLPFEHIPFKSEQARKKLADLCEKLGITTEQVHYQGRATTGDGEFIYVPLAVVECALPRPIGGFEAKTLEAALDAIFKRIDHYCLCAEGTRFPLIVNPVGSVAKYFDVTKNEHGDYVFTERPVEPAFRAPGIQWAAVIGCH